MFFSRYAAALTAIMDLALALPTNKVSKLNQYSVHQVETRTRARIGPVAHRRTLLKYGIQVPTNLHSAAEAALMKVTNGSEGSASATPYEHEIEYLVPVTVAGQTLMLDFDTGSADLWCFSSLLSSTDLSGHEFFTTSSASEVQGESWEIKYGDGSGASGSVYQGSVTVGGVTATSQAIEAASSISAQFQRNANSDGLLGLAFGTINQVKPTPQKTFFDNVQNQLASPLFTATLKKGAPGSYDFGFINSSSYTGDIAYVDVDSSHGFWGFQPSGYAVGIGSAQNTAFDAILDTGSSLWYMPTEAVKAYYSAVNGAQLDAEQGGYTFPCDADLPSMSAVVGGKTTTVPGTYINYAQVNQSTCFGGLQDGSSLPSNIFGDVFLKAHFAVFDPEGPCIGLAQQAGVDATPSGNAASSSDSGSQSDNPWDIVFGGGSDWGDALRNGSFFGSSNDLDSSDPEAKSLLKGLLGRLSNKLKGKR